MPTKLAFWTEYFEDAYRDAAKKRREVIDRGLLLIAHALREDLPTATAISISSGLLVAVHDGKETIWRFNDETTSGKLSHPNRNQVRDTLLDIRTFTSTSAPLLAAGWKQALDGSDSYRAELPADPDRDETETAPERPQGAPGETAGNCAQCGRQLIWDGTGKSVNDEWGEYLCSGPRTASRSAVHVLAVPKAADEPQTAQG